MPNSLAFIDHGLVTSFLNNRSKWLTDFPKEEIAKRQLHICAGVGVRKVAPGSTSPLRLTQAANAKYRSLCGPTCPCKPAPTEGGQHLDDDQNGNHNDKQHGNHHHHNHQHDHHNHDHHNDHDAHEQKSNKTGCKYTLSLNDTIENYQQQLPVISELALGLRLSVSSGACDIQKFFTQIRMNDDTAFRQAALVFRCWKTNLPTYSNSTEGKANEKSILIPQYCAFGICDLSQCAQACSNQIAEIFEAHLKSDKKHRIAAVEILRQAGIEAPWLLDLGWQWKFYSQQCDTKLRSDLYIDDHAASVALDSALLFLYQQSLHNTAPCTATKALCTDAHCTVHQLSLIHISEPTRPY